MKTTCGKCGRSIGSNILWQHKQLCDKSPLPIELAEIYLADDSMTMRDLCTKHFGMIFSNGVKRHLRFGLAQLGYSEDEMAQIAEERRLKVRKTKKRSDKPNMPKTRCHICDILTDRKNRAGVYKCKWCASPQTYKAAFNEWY